MNELIKYFEALEARLAALEERIATLEKTAADNRLHVEELQENADVIKQSVSRIQEMLDEGAHIVAEPEVEVELVYPEEETSEEPAPAEEQHPEAEPVMEVAPEPQPAPVEAEQPEAPAETEPAQAETQQAEAAKTRMPQQTSLFGAAVTDIRQAVSIGDRFLFQRELFGGNGERLQQALSDINALKSFDEAAAFIEKFGWDKQSPTYELFLNVLHRRFQ